MDLTSITPSPQQLKALTHPVRVRMLGMLRLDGPATATVLADRLGLNTGATSYHLRQLAQHGFVVEDPERGNARDRWWRAAHQTTTTDTAGPAEPEARDALDAYLQSVVTVTTERLQRSIEELPLLPEEWRDATTYSDWVVRLTPRKALAVIEALMTSIQEIDAEEDDDEAAPFVLQLNAFPYPGKVGAP
ncbi:winged helix-turn-helix domain-containing protein [Nocardioides mangrovi]|uniref:Helix-turn-helix domain-containing protein n=1 Tax=Nocardioides mangrovi TaxID=2874580 RepID=A0ABS7UAV1_9ACTN|nr:helix-turn-helix domain-containing protein [Nocardioides mangrovi]MBZ5738000.1 helix-turn-helix domain-containing protein [Nocardioides mangrovi]